MSLATLKAELQFKDQQHIIYVRAQAYQSLGVTSALEQSCPLSHHRNPGVGELD